MLVVFLINQKDYEPFPSVENIGLILEARNKRKLKISHDKIRVGTAVRNFGGEGGVILMYFSVPGF